MQASLPSWATLAAPADWTTVELISDLHLQPSEPATFAALQRYLDTCTADAVFMLGDLFEVWVGDDCLSAAACTFEQQVQSALAAAAQRRPLFFMAGNRDFLLGGAGLRACGLQGLEDPTVLEFGTHRWLLTHGDALCLADTDYQRFRAQVRSTEWQQRFLQMPLAARQAQARAIRDQSEAHKRETGYADVDTREVERWLDASRCQAMIHGHTHHAADHPAGASRTRHVLSDWDLHAKPPRAQVLRLEHLVSGEVSVQRHPVALPPVS